MKKIYLIDDNTDGTRNKYGGSFVDDGCYGDILQVIRIISTNTGVELINEAACVLIHRSCKDFARINDMLEMGTTIPYVIFSDGDSSDMGDYRPESPMVV